MYIHMKASFFLYQNKQIRLFMRTVHRSSQSAFHRNSWITFWCHCASTCGSFIHGASQCQRPVSRWANGSFVRNYKLISKFYKFVIIWSTCHLGSIYLTSCYYIIIQKRYFKLISTNKIFLCAYYTLQQNVMEMSFSFKKILNEQNRSMLTIA